MAPFQCCNGSRNTVLLILVLFALLSELSELLSAKLSEKFKFWSLQLKFLRNIWILYSWYLISIQKCILIPLGKLCVIICESEESIYANNTKTSDKFYPSFCWSKIPATFKCELVIKPAIGRKSLSITCALKLFIIGFCGTIYEYWSVFNCILLIYWKYSVDNYFKWVESCLQPPLSRLGQSEFDTAMGW